MTLVVLQFWAGARAAAGVESERYEAENVAQAIAEAGVRHTDGRLAKVLPSCSLLIDGRVLGEADLRARLTGQVTVEVLPPFAGGSTAACRPGWQTPSSCFEVSAAGR